MTMERRNQVDQSKVSADMRPVGVRDFVAPMPEARGALPPSSLPRPPAVALSLPPPDA